MRSLTNLEQSKIKALTKKQVPLTLIEPTGNGLKKSIMDATAPVRSYLKENCIHDYTLQAQGSENKVLLSAKIYGETTVVDSTASLYRPQTKKGDPRIWFSGLPRTARANDIIAFLYYDSSFHVFNLTKLDVNALITAKENNPLKELILEIYGDASQISNELLALLKGVAARGPIASMVDADTSVGRTLETALGIAINSSKQPDYKGIELKSYRGNRGNRKNLFAQVADWPLSKFKSSAEILDAFGYQRGEDFKLYCTVSALSRNSQGLELRLDQDIKQLIENSSKPEIGDFAVWSLDTLHNRLLEKHRETFWVEADCTRVDGKEYFQYKFVEHTKKPIVSQFDLLLDQGIITMDHLIKRNPKGKVVEKGPLFKIRPTGIDLLFPPKEKYKLL